MLNKKIVCLRCPRSCCIVVDVEKKNVTGNNCTKGKEFAFLEVAHPRRTLTSTIKVIGGDFDLVSVKTSAAIDRHLVKKCMDEIRQSKTVAPVHLGDIILENILSTGANIVATMDVKKRHSQFTSSD